ncbi:MAG TPA: copper-containing nitrite reductase [Terriglobales bacterium]|nr:copper-containing nitrite reductase [Terriglobales bacterium]
MERIHRSRLVVTAAAMLLLSVAAVGQQTHEMPAAKSGAAVNIVRDPAEVPPPVGDRAPATVRIQLVSKEVVGTLDAQAGTTFRYWTFNGKVPGPMIRVREGDTIEVSLRNEPGSAMVHSIDFHAAMGPGGGAALTQVTPGQEKTFTFVAATPGLYVYHCGTPMIGDHIANGMYGLILVEPAGGLPKVDHEYYVMQGEIYTAGPKGKSGLQAFSEAKLLAEQPDYVVFNGAVDSLTGKYTLKSKTGETVRLLFGNAGPNLTSSFHVVGHIFSKDYVLGGLESPPVTGIQTISAPAGGATLVEMVTNMPGKYPFMDHAMARMPKGLMGMLAVEGVAVADYMHPGPAPVTAAAGPAPQAMIVAQDDAVPATQSAGTGVLAMLPHDEAPESGTAATTEPAAKPVATVRTNELSGCLHLAPGTRQLRLTAFRSGTSYDLEPRAGLLSEHPLLFADNLNTLVQVNGRFEPAQGKRRFAVEAVTPLAPTCHPQGSLAALRRAAQAKMVRTAVEGARGRVGATVNMSEMAFLQRQVTIEAGQSVLWRNTSQVTHDVVTNVARVAIAAHVRTPNGAAMFDSGHIQPGANYQRTFNVPGIYKYVCTLHETGGMIGVVIVKPAPGRTEPAVMTAAAGK